jgi:hypothetical protein
MTKPYSVDSSRVKNLMFIGFLKVVLELGLQESLTE